MENRPVIGLSGSRQIIESGVFKDSFRSYVIDDYVKSVVEGGGIPVLLPFFEGADDRADRLLDNVDALILTGGHDIAPSFYGEQAKPKLRDVWPDRDFFDRDLLFTALKRKMPVFGICRGFQLINAVFGGRLLQDLSYSETNLLEHVQELSPEQPSHLVRLTEDSIFGRLFGTEVMTNSFHHQAVTTPGEGLAVCGRTDDGVIEAVASSDMNLIAVQWHPEMMTAASEPMRKLFRDFVESAADFRRHKCLPLNRE